MKIGFLGLLTIVFVILKLTHVIAWSWLWVTAPLWGGFLLGLLFAMFALAMHLWVGDDQPHRLRR